MAHQGIAEATAHYNYGLVTVEQLLEGEGQLRISRVYNKAGYWKGRITVSTGVKLSQGFALAQTPHLAYHRVYGNTSVASSLTKRFGKLAEAWGLELVIQEGR